MSSSPALSVVVLCGGRSKRMGRDKALIEIDGVPLFRRVAQRLEPLGEIILAPGTPGRLGTTGYAEIADDPADIGPLGGLVAGLTAASTELVAAVAVDMPLCDPSVLNQLSEMLEGRDAAVPISGGRLQPLHAVYSTKCAAVLRDAAARGIHSVGRAVETLDAITPTIEGGFATNLNFPQDLRL